jgi:hypothetical protein
VAPAGECRKRPSTRQGNWFAVRRRGWKMEDGRWRMEDGRSRIEEGGWKIENGPISSPSIRQPQSAILRPQSKARSCR